MTDMYFFLQAYSIETGDSSQVTVVLSWYIHLLYYLHIFSVRNSRPHNTYLTMFRVIFGLLFTIYKPFLTS